MRQKLFCRDMIRIKDRQNIGLDMMQRIIQRSGFGVGVVGTRKIVAPDLPGGLES